MTETLDGILDGLDPDVLEAALARIKAREAEAAAMLEPEPHPDVHIQDAAYIAMCEASRTRARAYRAYGERTWNERFDLEEGSRGRLGGGTGMY